MPTKPTLPDKQKEALAPITPTKPTPHTNKKILSGHRPNEALAPNTVQRAATVIPDMLVQKTEYISAPFLSKKNTKMSKACSCCSTPQTQLMIWRKKHGESVFTGIVLRHEPDIPSEWTKMGEPNYYMLTNPNDIHGARTLLTVEDIEPV